MSETHQAGLPEAEQRAVAAIMQRACGGVVQLELEPSPEGGSGRANLFRCTMLVARLQQRWPEVAPMPFYPAFR